MPGIVGSIRKHPVASYFILTFLISWGGVLILGAPYGMPTTSERFTRVWPIVFIPYFLGPSLSSLILTGIVDGREGYRRLGARLAAWRLHPGWYAFAILLAPLLVIVILSLLSLTSSDYLPAIVTAEDKAGTLIMGLSVGLFLGGLLEELGWTGFATPRLLDRGRGVLAAGVIIGFLHGLWHVLPTFWGSGDEAGRLLLVGFVPPLFFYAGVLPAFRVLMVWVYDRTASLLVCMLMHASLTAATLFILSPGARGLPLVIYYLILTPAMWIVAAWVLRWQRRIPGAAMRVKI